MLQFVLKSSVTVCLAIFASASANAASDSTIQSSPTTDVSPADLRPSWQSQEGVWNAPNSSLLSDYHYTDSVNPLDPLFDKQTAAQMRQRYEDLNRNYEIKQSYGLMDGYGSDEQALNGAQSGLAQDALHHVENVQGQNTLNNAKDKMQNNDDLHPLIAPAAVMGGAAAVWRGSGVNFKVTDDTKLRAKASIRNRTGGLELNSPIVHSSLDMSVATPNTVDPTQPPPLDPLARQERYRLSLSRGLPFDVSSGVSYGSTTSTMSAQLSRPIMPNLTAALSSAKTTNPSLAAIAPSEQSVKLMYGFHF